MLYLIILSIGLIASILTRHKTYLLEDDLPPKPLWHVMIGSTIIILFLTSVMSYMLPFMLTLSTANYYDEKLVHMTYTKDDIFIQDIGAWPTVYLKQNDELVPVPKHLTITPQPTLSDNLSITLESYQEVQPVNVGFDFKHNKWTGFYSITEKSDIKTRVVKLLIPATISNNDTTDTTKLDLVQPDNVNTTNE